MDSRIDIIVEMRIGFTVEGEAVGKDALRDFIRSHEDRILSATAQTVIFRPDHKTIYVTDDPDETRQVGIDDMLFCDPQSITYIRGT